MNKFQTKLPKVGETIFTTMSALAQKHQAINLSQGFPDFSIDTILLECLKKAITDYGHQYAPMAGLPVLREKIAEEWFKKHHFNIDPHNEITITSGATEAIFDAVQAIVHSGDEVIILEPCYDSYIPAIELAGAVPVPVSLDFPTYTIDFQKLYHAITPKTKAIIINSPNNPTGSVITKQEFLQLEKLFEEFPNLYLISDEVYENIVFDGHKHHSVLDFEGLRNRSFAVYSFGKSLHITGWKIGYCIANQALTTEFRKVHQYVTFSSPTPLQYAIYLYMVQKPDYYKELPGFFEKKRNLFLELLKNSHNHAYSSWNPIIPLGTYFILLNYHKISHQNDVLFAKELTEKFGLATIPVSVFYQKPLDNKVLRLCFGKKEETLIQAVEKLVLINQNLCAE